MRTETDSPTATPDESPRIVSYSATPQQNGQSLTFSVKAEDDTDLQRVAVTYGSEEWTREDIDGTRLDDSGQFTGLSANNPDDGRVLFLAGDAAGQQARKEVFPDETAPELRKFHVEPTATAGAVAVTIEAADDVGLESLRVLLGDKEHARRAVPGQQNESLDRVVNLSGEATLGENNTVTAAVADWNGNTTARDADTYVRKFDLMEKTRLRFGAVYQPYTHQFNTKEMDGRVPTVGQYENPFDAWVFKRHVDQMTGFGIDRIMLEVPNFPNTRKENRRFLEETADLLADIEIEPFYTVPSHYWREHGDRTADSYRELVNSHFGWIREHILSLENVATYGGRPILQNWAANTWAVETPRRRILDTFGSYEEFVNEIRAILRVDGNDPFIINNAAQLGANGNPNNYGTRAENLHKHFDGITTWVGGGAWGDDGTATQEEALEYVEANWQQHRKFTDSHDMEFVPMVFPGFNDIETDRRTPRSPDFLEQLLELAEEYRTTDLVNSSVYNQWGEATHLEPGVFEPGPFGEDNYGTAYIEKVKQFQKVRSG